MSLFILALVVIARIYVWIVIASILLSYFMDPYHPVRQGVDNLVRPLLDPIRKVIPPMGMFDFSPLVLILVIQAVTRLLGSLL